MFLDAVFDHFSRGRPQSFFVGGADGLDWAVDVVHVSSEHRSLIRSIVVKATDGVHTIDGVCPDYVLFPKMRVAVC